MGFGQKPEPEFGFLIFFAFSFYSFTIVNGYGAGGAD
jgi:hypothetical protein